MRYILFNKPYGVLSQFTDEGTGHPTLKQYIDIPGIYAAGRLDRDSEGLLLLTDDGPLIKRLTDPKHHLEKNYWVMAEGNPTQEKLTQLERGIQLKDYLTLPAKVRLIPDPNLPPRSKPTTPHGPTAWIEIKLREGKKRQIRHMTAAVGLPTLRLISPNNLGLTSKIPRSQLAVTSLYDPECKDYRKRLNNFKLSTNV